MSFNSIASDELKKTLAVLKRRDKATFIAVKKKMYQIASCDSISINHFKNLKGDMSNLKRVHVGSFVLLFQVKGDAIIFESFRHHDEAYRR